MLKGLGLEHELLVEDEDEIRYSVSAPVDVRTKDVSTRSAWWRAGTSSSGGKREEHGKDGGLVGELDDRR